MRQLVRATSATCRQCKWSMGFGSQPSRIQTEEVANNNIACDYLARCGHSRIFENREMAYDPIYCDKFEKGPRENNIVQPVLTRVGWPLGYNPYQE